MQLRTVSLTDWTSGDPARKADFVRKLGLGLEELGFVCIEDPGLDTERLQSAYDHARQMFDLPLEAKLACEQADNGRQRGYTPFGTEHAKDQSAADLKEFWHVGRTLPADHPLTVSGDIPPNAYPEKRFQEVFDTLFLELEDLSDNILEAVGLYLGLDDDTFRDMTRDGSSVLRIIHYPPLPETVPEGAVRAAAHEDINLMTILPVSTASGLELLTRDGEWLAVETPPGTVIVDTGDMMALLTGKRLPATTHRVSNPSGEAARKPRYSMPFFIHPHPDVHLHPFDGESEGPTSRDFLMERLIAIGVAKG